MLSLMPHEPEFPTASELRTAAECVAPWTLGLPTEDAPTDAMMRGRERHELAQRFAEAIIDGHRPMATNGWERSIIEALMADNESAAEHRVFLVEQGVYWRPMGLARAQAGLIDRKPGERMRGAFPGTVDLARVDPAGVLHVVDWKLGEMGSVYELPAAENPQLWLLALALCAALNISASSPSVVIARVELRHVHDDGAIDVDACDISHGELDSFAEQMEALADRIRDGASAMPTRSAACGRCKSQKHCPSWQAMETKLLEDIEPNPLAGPPRTADEARRLSQALGLLSSLDAIGTQRLHAWIDANGPLEIGLGLRLRLDTESKRRALDTPEAIAVIRELAGDGAIEMKPHVTVESIARAAKRAAESKKDEAAKRVLTDLEERGAIVRGALTRVVRVVRTGEEET